jgi:hypothetical protein
MQLSDLTIKSATYTVVRADYEYLVTVTSGGVVVIRADTTLDAGQTPQIQGYSATLNAFVHITELDNIHHFPSIESALEAIDPIP